MAPVRRRFDPTKALPRINKRHKQAKNELASRALSEQEAWTIVGSGGLAPTFGAGFSAGGTIAPGFYLDSVGRVHLKGRVTVGTVGNTMFTLPVGYRPLEDHRFPASQGSAYAGISVQANGAVVFQAGTSGGTGLELSGIAFRAEQ